MELKTASLEIGHHTGKLELEGQTSYDLHAQIEISRQRYDTLKRRAKANKNESAFHVVGVDGRYWVVGERAYREEGVVEARQDLSKFSSEYMRPQLISHLLRVTRGDMPAALNAMIGHAPKYFDHVDKVRRSILGKCTYEYPHGSGTLSVKRVTPVDEIVGGMSNVLFGGGKSDVSNGRILAFDLGGRTLDMMYLEDGEPVYDEIFSEDLGGNQYIKAFCELVAQEHPAIVAGTGDGRFPFTEAHRVLISKDYKYEHLGDVYDLAPQVFEAFTPLLNTIDQRVKTFAHGFLNVRGVLKMGGISDLLYDRLIAPPDKDGRMGVFYPFVAQGKKAHRVHLAGRRGVLFLAVVGGLALMARELA